MMINYDESNSKKVHEHNPPFRSNLNKNVVKGFERFFGHCCLHGDMVKLGYFFICLALTLPEWPFCSLKTDVFKNSFWAKDKVFGCTGGWSRGKSCCWPRVACCCWRSRADSDSNHMTSSTLLHA